MRIEWTPAALADLADILAHLPADIAARAVDRIAQAEANILVFPRAAFYHPDTDVYERYVPNTTMSGSRIITKLGSCFSLCEQS